MIKLKQANARNFETLRMMTFCGEQLRKLHVESIFDARRDLVVHNTYGPTEATVSCTLARLTAEDYEDACQSVVAIGDTIPDMSIDLLGGGDASEGEIVISGPQLADGYWNAPELTARQFRAFVSGGVERRGYFTGDWAKRIGRHVFFRARIDHQVKVRGERVELEDIGAALMRAGGCFACAVLIGEELHGVFERDAPGADARSLRESAHCARSRSSSRPRDRGKRHGSPPDPWRVLPWPRGAAAWFCEMAQLQSISISEIPKELT
jgi:D-alanine--poly(phosphoribitol) ligase subunit 1